MHGPAAPVLQRSLPPSEPHAWASRGRAFWWGIRCNVPCLPRGIACIALSRCALVWTINSPSSAASRHFSCCLMVIVSTLIPTLLIQRGPSLQVQLLANPRCRGTMLYMVSSEP